MVSGRKQLLDMKKRDYVAIHYVTAHLLSKITSFTGLIENKCTYNPKIEALYYKIGEASNRGAVSNFCMKFFRNANIFNRNKKTQL